MPSGSDNVHDLSHVSLRSALNDTRRSSKLTTTSATKALLNAVASRSRFNSHVTLKLCYYLYICYTEKR